MPSPPNSQRPTKHWVCSAASTADSLKHSPQAAPACLQDMSICQDVRVEDMGHKQGCNGVDNGKLWFNRELLQQNSKAICSCWKWSLGVLAPVFAVAA